MVSVIPDEARQGVAKEDVSAKEDQNLHGELAHGGESVAHDNDPVEVPDRDGVIEEPSQERVDESAPIIVRGDGNGNINKGAVDNVRKQAPKKRAPIRNAAENKDKVAEKEENPPLAGKCVSRLTHEDEGEVVEEEKECGGKPVANMREPILDEDGEEVLLARAISTAPRAVHGEIDTNVVVDTGRKSGPNERAAIADGDASDARLLPPLRISGVIDENEDFDYDPSVLRVKCRHCAELIPFRPFSCILLHERDCKRSCNPCNGIFPQVPNVPAAPPMAPVPASSLTSPPRLPDKPKPIFCKPTAPNIDQQLCIDARLLKWREFYKRYVRKVLSDLNKEPIINNNEDGGRRIVPDADTSVQLFDVECDGMHGAVYRSLFLADGTPAYGIRRNSLVYLVKMMARYYKELKMLENLYIVMIIIIAFYKPRTDWALEAIRKRFTPEQVRRNKVIKRIYVLLGKVDKDGHAVETDNLEKILRNPQEENLHPAHLVLIFDPPLFGPLFSEDGFIIGDDDDEENGDSNSDGDGETKNRIEY